MNVDKFMGMLEAAEAIDTTGGLVVAWSLESDYNQMGDDKVIFSFSYTLGGVVYDHRFTADCIRRSVSGDDGYLMTDDQGEEVLIELFTLDTVDRPEGLDVS